MRTAAGFFALVLMAGCAEGRLPLASRCGLPWHLCPAAPDSTLVDLIAKTWAIELDPPSAVRGPVVLGRGGDSAWTVAVYAALERIRPQYFVLPIDSARAPHLTGVSVEMFGDTARVTTSVSQCFARSTTFNWTESGLDHHFVRRSKEWVLLPGSLAHVADGKC